MAAHLFPRLLAYHAPSFFAFPCLFLTKLKLRTPSQPFCSLKAAASSPSLPPYLFLFSPSIFWHPLLSARPLSLAVLLAFLLLLAPALGVTRVCPLICRFGCHLAPSNPLRISPVRVKSLSYPPGTLSVARNCKSRTPGLLRTECGGAGQQYCRTAANEPAIARQAAQPTESEAEFAEEDTLAMRGVPKRGTWSP